MPEIKGLEWTFDMVICSLWENHEFQLYGERYDKSIIRRYWDGFS